MGGADAAGEVFVSFLIRFGRVKRGLGIASSGRSDDTIDTQRCCTHIHAQSVLQGPDGYEADMSNVFLVEHCVDLFQRCYSKLAQRQNTNGNQLMGGSPRSILVDLYNIQQLKRDRHESLEKASKLELYSKSNKNATSDNRQNPSGDRQNGNKRRRS